jgi:DNA-binding FadR family transcriptional regulator
VLDALRETLLDLRREAMSLPGNLEKGIEAHARILDAVAARDPGRARHEMVQHIAISERESFGFRGSAEDSTPAPRAGAPEVQRLTRG